MKLFIDDVREAPDASWTVVRTLGEALAMVKSGVTFEMISFDHDLGWDEDYKDWVDTVPVAEWFEAEAEAGRLLVMPPWQLHSMNFRGRRDLTAALERAQKFIDDRPAP